jgi:hypothetical protein
MQPRFEIEGYLVNETRNLNFAGGQSRVRLAVCRTPQFGEAFLAVGEGWTSFPPFGPPATLSTCPITILVFRRTYTTLQSRWLAYTVAIAGSPSKSSPALSILA